MTNEQFIPLPEGEPREGLMRRSRGGTSRTHFYRDQLMSNPGKWFVWRTGKKYSTDTGVALKTLTGLPKLTGLDRKALPYQAVSQKQEDNTYTTYVRYTGENSATGADESVLVNPFSN